MQAFRVKPGQRIVNAPGLGAMGTGLPGTIGGCLASGRRRTICVNGDGGFQLNIQELETVRRLNLPIKYFVLCNGGYASIMATQRNYFQGRYVGSEPSSQLTLPNVMRVAEAYGIATAHLGESSRYSRKGARGARARWSDGLRGGCAAGPADGPASYIVGDAGRTDRVQTDGRHVALLEPRRVSRQHDHSSSRRRLTTMATGIATDELELLLSESPAAALRRERTRSTSWPRPSKETRAVRRGRLRQTHARRPASSRDRAARLCRDNEPVCGRPVVEACAYCRRRRPPGSSAMPRPSS